MAVRIDHGHGYVEEFTDEQWTEIVQWSAELQQLMYGWTLRNRLPPAVVPAALAGPKHLSRGATGAAVASTPQCTCRTTFSSGTSGRTGGLTVPATAPGR